MRGHSDDDANNGGEGDPVPGNGEHALPQAFAALIAVSPDITQKNPSVKDPSPIPLNASLLVITVASNHYMRRMTF